MANTGSAKKSAQAGEEEKTSFTIEIDTSHTVEVPSINRLLNRRSLNRGGSRRETDSNTNTQPFVLPSNEPATSPNVSAPMTRPAKRPRLVQKLVIWTIDLLRNSPDPFGKGIAKLFERGANGALFLSLAYGAQGRTQADIECTSTAAVAAETKINIWTGLKWMPSSVPQAWDQLIRQGSIEISPPSADTLAVSYRSMMRTAFGLLPGEWLLLVRVGPERSCRGIIAFISPHSLYKYLPEVSKLFLNPVASEAKVDLPNQGKV